MSNKVPIFLVICLVATAGCSGTQPTGPSTTTAKTTTTSTATLTTTESTPTTTTTSTTIATSTTTATPTTTTTTRTTPKGPDEGTAWTVTITRVIDGDTVEAKFPNGETDTLRLLGVDTPETTPNSVTPGEFEGIPDTAAGRDHLTQWGYKAKQYAKNQLSGKTVRIEVDPAADRRGSYGRLLVYVYVGNEHFNEQLLRNGYARVYESSFSSLSEFNSIEADAQQQDEGLWDFEKQESVNQPKDTAKEDDDNSDVPPPPADGDYDCSHFDTQSQAQQVLEDSSGDPHRLDADSDGEACESLP